MKRLAALVVAVQLCAMAHSATTDTWEFMKLPEQAAAGRARLAEAIRANGTQDKPKALGPIQIGSTTSDVIVAFGHPDEKGAAIEKPKLAPIWKDEKYYGYTKENVLLVFNQDLRVAKIYVGAPAPPDKHWVGSSKSGALFYVRPATEELINDYDAWDKIRKSGGTALLVEIDNTHSKTKFTCDAKFCTACANDGATFEGRRISYDAPFADPEIEPREKGRVVLVFSDKLNFDEIRVIYIKDLFITLGHCE